MKTPKKKQQVIFRHDNTIDYVEAITPNYLRTQSIRLRSKQIGAYDDVFNEIESITR